MEYEWNQDIKYLLQHDQTHGDHLKHKEHFILYDSYSEVFENDEKKKEESRLRSHLLGQGPGIPFNLQRTSFP